MKFDHSTLRRVHRFVLTIALAVMLSTSAAAQSTGPQLRAVVSVVPPFVMQENGSLTGFSIDLWNAIAARFNVQTKYQRVTDAPAAIEALLSNSADVIVSPVVMTAARDEQVDFSMLIFQGGLEVMVRDTGQKATTNPLEDLVDLLFSKTAALWLGIALLLILVPAHLVWFFERRRDDGILGNRNYFPGIFEAMYWAISCLATQAENMPHQWIARIFSAFWMFAGVVFVAFYTAQLTATLTVQQIQGSINGPDDLPGKRIGTMAKTIAAGYLHAHYDQVQEFERLDDMYQALLDKNIDAVVYAAPVLLYYAAHEGQGRVKVVGPEFEAESVGFTFPIDSPLRRKVNGALLAMREDGTYQQLYRKWFGNP
jgi:polar amino acid transport system substrate-binding protein